ncbi:MAG: zf-HC2 domain-containing protein [Acidimicrobiia bacterium]
MSDHRQYREWPAAYVLGALDSDERASFANHLAGCEECREEVVSLAPLPGLLSQVDPDQPAAPTRIVELASRSIETEWKSMHQSRRRWRWTAAIAGVAATVALLIPAPQDGGTNDGTALAFEQGTAASGTVLVIEKPWGTAVEIEVVNLPESDKYVAWAVAENGEWQPMATWGPTLGANARVTGASSVATNDLYAIVITTGDQTNTVAIASKDA